jgi:membrane protease YdiL (CAAX protease family)
MKLDSPEFREHEVVRNPIPAIVRFLLAVVLVAVVNVFVPMACYSLLGEHVIVADAAYRWLGTGLLIGGFLFFSRLLDQVEDDPWTYIGLPGARGSVRQSILGLLIGGLMVSIAVGLIAIIGTLDFHPILTDHTLTRSLLITILLVGGAMLEELMFRGYPFQRLIESIGIPGAILVLSIFFGAVHLGNPNAGGFWSWGFFNTIAVGVLFAVAYLRTRTLWFPFGIHFGWNFFLGVVYGLPVSGIRDFSVIVRGAAHGPRLLTGGAYGVEASLTGSLVILMGIVAVAILPQNWLDCANRRRQMEQERI